MQIRNATLSDNIAIARLAGQLGYTSLPEMMRKRLAPVLSADNQAVFIAESDQAEVVGWVHIFQAQRLISEPFAEIGGLVVNANHRSLGIGQALMAQAEKWASTNGLQTIRIRSNTIRESAHRFYEGLGYDLDKTQKVFIKKQRPGGSVGV